MTGRVLSKAAITSIFIFNGIVQNNQKLRLQIRDIIVIFSLFADWPVEDQNVLSEVK